MRPGAELVTSSRVRKVNLNYIVRRLEACCNKYGKAPSEGYRVCDGCPDMKVCVEGYDDRCGYIPKNKQKKLGAWRALVAVVK